MKIIKPTIIRDKSLAEAHEHAKANNEPVFVPMSVFADDRGWSHMNLMQGVLGPEGQINISQVYPGTIKAWHRLVSGIFWASRASLNLAHQFP